MTHNPFHQMEYSLSENPVRGSGNGDLLHSDIPHDFSGFFSFPDVTRDNIVS